MDGVDAWKELELPFRTWVIVLCGVVLFWFFLAFSLAFCCGPSFVECHLCEEPIPHRRWNKKDHWDSCARDHERFISELPDTDHHCPKCNRLLKLWPKVGPDVFKCHIGKECDPLRQKNLAKGLAFEEKALDHPDRLIDVGNNGESRLTCFHDGYDVCKRCAEDCMPTQPQMTATTTASTLNNMSTSTSHTNNVGGGKQLNGGWFDVQLRTISHQVAEKENGNVIVVDKND